MSDLAGQLVIDLDAESGSARIRSTRSLAAVRVFSGKPPEAVVRQLPSLFSLCGTAQAAVCVGACEQALGVRADPAAQRWRARLVRAETVKEHLWRLLLDWPKVLAPAVAAEAGMPLLAQAIQAFVRLRQALQGTADPFALGASDPLPARSARAEPAPVERAEAEIGRLRTGVDEQALHAVPEEWLQAITDLDQFQRWAEATPTLPAQLVRAVLDEGLESCGANPVSLLPVLPSAALAQRLAAADASAFVAAPRWEQQCWETGPLARAASHPLVARLVTDFGNGVLAHLAALLVELARAASALDDAGETPSDAASAWSPRLAGTETAAERVGVAQIQASRGLLVHRVAIVDGLVQHYQILAPTEWNFHPQGVVAEGLSAIAQQSAGRARLERFAHLYVTAVDPCVDYRLSVS